MLVLRSSRELVLLVVIVILFETTNCSGESSTCLAVYKEGGAPAVFQSPKCPRWKLTNYASRLRTSAPSRCQSAMLQGRRKYQEDRTLCALDIRVPFPARMGLKEVMIGIVAVFDGHNGAEASEMASRLLLEYFAVHTHFLLDATYSFLLKKSARGFTTQGELDVPFQVLNWDEQLGQHELNLERFKLLFPSSSDDSFHLQILKQALLRAIQDVDVTFSEEASRNNLDSGSTATVMLIADGQILVANIGDSKAFLCSEQFYSPAEAEALLRLYREQRRNGAVSRRRDREKINFTNSNGLTHYFVKELTRDHHPDREDERFRVETAGGYVHEWGGIPRVNGQLAVSRAIGDVPFKIYGVISMPEVTDWQPLTINDSYAVAASDGVFEKLSLQDVCDVIWKVSHGTMRSGLSSSCSYSLADCIVNTAFEKGSMDNVAVVVVPLGSLGISETMLMETCLGEDDIDCPASALQKFTSGWSANDVTSHLLEAEHADSLITPFDRLLVDGKRGSLGCFYLSESLSDMYHTPKEDVEQYMYHSTQALPAALNNCCGGPINLYNDQSMCFHFGMTANGAKDQCINHEGFATFLGLLESIPFQDTGSNHGSSEHATPDLRYLLKKRFGRGSYGEVWLAFHWNCHQGHNISSWCMKTGNTSSDENSNHSSTRNCGDGFPNDNLFILKRILVERGAAVYLSGLREKHFGEVFLNASKWLGDFLSNRMSMTLQKESTPDLHDLFVMNDSVVHELGYPWNSENGFRKKFKQHKAAYEEGLDHIARYVESFESRSNEIWLVFRHEGISMSKLMYTVESNADEESAEDIKRVQVLRPSKWWHWLKTTNAGKEQMRSIIWQLLMALKSCHERNITHRDIKPENMVICFEDQETGMCLKGFPSGNETYTTKMRIIDFGSAIDEFTMRHLYGSSGPSRAEQTYEYSPPEAFLNASWYQGPASRTSKYDMWSVGVVMLELILGSPNVFQISALTQSLLDQHIGGWKEELKELAYRLRSFMELCILIPGSSSKHHRVTNDGGVSPASWKCSEEFFSNQIQTKDPLGLGFPDVWALRLVRQLLRWDPEDRLSIDDALQHPYFHPPPIR
ncbi:uncharacterized protein LOC120010391 isoform X2 [Tripterygium wilfordii]|uniref:uncharacterized protein LOC120010391 isoform X2 n=1 Tax=Tripterygium wilfordii TaxID=458696 RepID=UPI0018F814F3|nr:uncharacterized protein LOC120010391 isoform X2 [Tripterygium wilfordii]